MTVETTTKSVESIVNAIAPVIGAAVSAIAPETAPLVASAQAALTSAETVTNAVETEVPHNTAVAAIGAGVTALAGTPIVQSHPQAAAAPASRLRSLPGSRANSPSSNWVAVPWRRFIPPPYAATFYWDCAMSEVDFTPISRSSGH